MNVTSNNKKLVVFGATGGTGQAIVREALERGYSVTAFVRDIARARQLFNNHDPQASLTFVEGDAMNAGDVQRAFAENKDEGKDVRRRRGPEPACGRMLAGHLSCPARQ